jgi:uncharacterized protein YceK
MKRILLVLLCLTLVLMMTGCATVNGNNSFQGAAPNGISASPQNAGTQPADDAAQPTPETVPTSDPNASGYNG